MHHDAHLYGTGACVRPSNFESSLIAPNTDCCNEQIPTAAAVTTVPRSIAASGRRNRALLPSRSRNSRKCIRYVFGTILD
jgi:hypothetical protein